MCLYEVFMMRDFSPCYYTELRNYVFQSKICFLHLTAIRHNIVCSSQAYRYNDFVRFGEGSLVTTTSWDHRNSFHVECGLFFSSLPRFLRRKMKEIPCIHYNFTPLPKIVILTLGTRKDGSRPWIIKLGVENE